MLINSCFEMVVKNKWLCLLGNDEASHCIMWWAAVRAGGEPFLGLEHGRGQERERSLARPALNPE